MKFSRIAWLLVALCAGFTQIARADEPAAGPGPDELFGKLDKNADGKLTSAEIGEEQARFFERLVRVGDKDGNNVLTKDEFREAVKNEHNPVSTGFDMSGRIPGKRPRMDPKQLVERFDANKDGKLSREEMPEPMRERLQPLLDRIGKTEVTAEELERLQRRRDGAPEGKGGPPEEGRVLARMFDRLDTNKDGKLVAEELQGPAKERLERRLKKEGKELANGITKEEFAHFFQRGGPKGPGRPGAEPRPDGPRPPEGEGNRGPRDGPRPGFGPPRLPRFFERLDANGDHHLTKDELSKAADLFEELDENGDKQLDPRELLGPPPGEGGPKPR